jgi:hypothetical protein
VPDVSISSIGGLAWLTNILVVATTALIFAFLVSPRMRGSELWRATATPLASIIGSGFLVVAPLLGYTVGNWAIVAMAGIVTLAYAVGAAVRYNILHVEETTESRENGSDTETLLKWLERAGKIALTLAYVVAITFYLELLAAFVLRLFDAKSMFDQKLIATVLIVFIGGFGYWRGLHQLETLEKYSVDTKLAIIGGFLVGLAVLNVNHLITGTWELSEFDVDWNIDTVRKLLGAFLIVQGFETSRYLRNVYSQNDRAATMRYAQVISAVIYLLFVGLASILLGHFNSISETGIIDLSEDVAFVVPFLLVVGAVMAQFSAAVADTLASGGLVEAATYGKVPHRYVYLVVMALALALLWSSHILSIIAYASRAFAGYYAIQCAIAALHSALIQQGKAGISKAAGFSVLGLLMLFTAIFGIPAESVQN